MYEPRESKLFIKTRFARRGIYWLPNLFTIIALFAGFYAIVQAMSGRFEQAAMAIFIAMVFDGLDGRVARLTRTQSAFGAEYDSLADMVSFGVAPALVVYVWALKDFAGMQTVAWLGPGAHLVTYPLDRNGTINLVAVTEGRAAEGWAEPGDRAELMQAFANWAPEARGLVASAQTWVKWPLYDGEPVGGRGPVTLIGDAAHPVLPHAAQGAAMAMEDAAMIARCIASRASGG